MAGGPENDIYDVAVIGAGIVGASTALHLLMRGKKVVLLDRRGAGEETSYGNAGEVGSSYVIPFGVPPLKRLPSIFADRNVSARFHYPSFPRFLPWLIGYFLGSGDAERRRNGSLLRPLIAASFEEYRSLLNGSGGERHLSPNGRVTIYRDEACFAANQLELQMAREIGVPFEVMDPAAFREVEPHVKPAYYKAALWKAGARLNNPGAAVKAIAARFAREGGTFLQNGARNLETGGDGWRIDTGGGGVRARQIAVCAGPWANEALKPLGYRFPLGFKRGYHRHFAAAGNATLSRNITDVKIGYVICPMEQGYRITSGAEFAELDAPPNPAQVGRALPYARELFPLGEPVERDAWMGSRPCFTDSLPVTGPAPRHENLWLNFGHGHMGMTIGPPTGRLLAEMICGEKPFCDPHPYRAERFSA